MAVLEAKNLKKYYGTVHALNNVSISIEKGELLAVIGPSGSGKTTLLRSIAGFVALNDGEIYISGRKITNIPPEKRNVAMFFQNYALWPHMNVYENIAYGLKVRKMDKKIIKNKVKTVAEMLDIKELLSRKPGQLSGGQQQRVALCRALIKEPEVLLLDEPLSNLDAKLRINMRGELKRLQKELGVTTVFVTHDQIEAMTMADRIAVMQDGVLKQYSTPDELYGKPKDLSVAGFIGSPPMNFLDAVKTEHGVKVLKDYEIEISFDTNKKELVLGIRPEDIKIGEGIDTEVYISEPLGREKLVTLSRNGYKFKVLTSDDFSIDMGHKLKAKFPPNKLHIFDKETHVRII